MLRAKLKGLSPRLGVCAIVLTLIGLCSMPGDVQPQEKTKADTSGDALPSGALARLGTLRWRHGDTVTFVAFPADGKSVLTASQDQVIRLWDRETGKELRRFVAAQAAGQPGQPAMWMGNVRGASRVAMSPDGKIVASVLSNTVIQLWETSTGKELRQIKSPPQGIAALVFSPDSKTLALRASNRNIHLMDIANGNEIRQLQIAPKQKAGVAVFVIGFQGNGDASAIAFAPDGKTIAASNTLYDNQKVTYSVKMINVENGNVLRTIDAEVNQAVNAVAFSHDGKALAFSNFNAIKLIDPDTGKDIRAIKAPMGASMLVFSPNGKTLAAKGRDQVVRLFDVETGNESRQFGDAPAAGNPNQVFFTNYNTADPRDLAFSPDGKSLAIGSGHVLRFFEVGTGKELPMAGGHRGPVNGVATSPDGKTIVSRGSDNVIRTWDAATGNEIGQFDAPKGTTCAAFSPDLRLVALGNFDTTISVREVATGKEVHRLTGHANGTAVVAFAPNGKLLASRGSVEQIVRIFDLAKGTEIKQIAIQPDVPANPNAPILIRSGYYGNVGLGLAFSTDSQSIAANVPANTNQFRNVGGVIQPVGAGNMLRIWDVSTAKETRQIPLQAQQAVVSIAFPPGGRVIAVENSDQTVTIWEIASGRERSKIGTAAQVVGNPAMGGFGGAVFVGGVNRFGGQPQASTFAFSSTGLLASKGPDHSVRIWDLASGGTEIGQFKGHQGPIASLAFAPNGKTLVTGSNDTTLLVWDVASLKRGPAPQLVKLQAKEVETLWSSLIGDDGVKANQTILKLAGSPSEAVRYFATQLKPATPPDLKQIDRWIADLDSSNFKLRGTAAVELEKLGELAVPALKKVLASPGSLETRRRVEPMVERLTGGVLSAEQVRTTRAIEVLEQIGTAEARELLDTLAQGAPGAYITRQAQLALEGLSKQR